MLNKAQIRQPKPLLREESPVAATTGDVINQASQGLGACPILTQKLGLAACEQKLIPSDAAREKKKKKGHNSPYPKQGTRQSMSPALRTSGDAPRLRAALL